MRITIIGAGNSGLIHAAKLAENNFEVAILKTSDSGNVDFFNIIAKDSAYDVVIALVRLNFIIIFINILRCYGFKNYINK